MVSRRKFLVGGAVVGAASLYSYQRGLRYPRLSFEHPPLADSHQIPHAELLLKDAIVTGPDTLRAIAPEPRIQVNARKGRVKFSLTNVAPNAELNIDGKGIKLIDEEVDGLGRTISIDSAIEQTLNMSWLLPVNDGFEFAVMGDTGGGSELTWTLKRAHELGAQFLLHLGDFNYSDGEYARAIEQFSAAPLPCYVTIGNHDFHHRGLIYHDFLKQIGPMNHAFELAGTRFINLDTAADFFPAHAGQRGALIRNLKTLEPFQGEQVFFTHRPLKDPRPHDDHEVGGVGEIDWLIEEIRALGGKNFVHGHVHHSAELDFQGLRQFSVGEGLGHENLVLQKQVAKIMMASVEPASKLKHRWADLNMPWSDHQSPTHTKKLKRDGRTKQLEWYQQLIKT